MRQPQKSAWEGGLQQERMCRGPQEGGPRCTWSRVDEVGRDPGTVSLLSRFHEHG